LIEALSDPSLGADEVVLHLSRGIGPTEALSLARGAELFRAWCNDTADEQARAVSLQAACATLER
jgi:hypothetical protein